MSAYPSSAGGGRSSRSSSSANSGDPPPPGRSARYGSSRLPDAVTISIAMARDGWAWSWDYRQFRAVTVERGRSVPLLVAEVVAGDGWVSGPDRQRVPIAAGQAAFWEPGEEHETGTDTGLTAVVLEGDDLSVWAAPGGPGT